MTRADTKQEILLEAGTNELEVLVFTLGSVRYGVNVAKVREIIGHVKLIRVPKMHPAIVGVFKLRDSVIPLVDLQLFFQPGVPSTAMHRTVILMEFNDLRLGFLVDSVDRIFRMSWSDVRPMPLTNRRTHAAITSVCEVDGKLVLMVDFEKITVDIEGKRNIYELTDTVIHDCKVDRSAQHVLLAEDSGTIREAIETNLAQAGYAHVTSLPDGSKAWEALSASAEEPAAGQITIVVTDIEMPQMDGLHLCKRIREDARFRHLPVVVFSSLVSDTNLKKCTAVGADAAITKPQMSRLVELLDKLLTTRQNPTGTGHAQKEELVVIA